MRLSILVAAIALAACASTEMKPYVGRPIEDVLLAYGPPAQTIDMADGRRAYQFPWGGTAGAAVNVGSGLSVFAAGSNSRCLLTFIASKSDDGRFVVDGYRTPPQSAC